MIHVPPTTTKNNRQTGFALIVGLLLLTVMSLVGVTMLRVTSLETLMAGGARESSIAFQAAEAALRDAEAAIELTTAISIDFPAGNTADVAPVGHVAEGQADPDYTDEASWEDDQSIAYSTGDYPEVLAQPRYIVKHVGDVIDEAAVGRSISIGGYAQQTGTPTVSIFRVTARGTSRDGSATTTLQSYYGKSY